MLIYHDNVTTQSIIGIIIALVATQCYQYIKLNAPKNSSFRSGLGSFRSPFPAHIVPFEQRQQMRNRALFSASGPYSKFKKFVLNSFKRREAGSNDSENELLSTIEEGENEDQASISTTPHSYSHVNNSHHGLSGGGGEPIRSNDDDGGMTGGDYGEGYDHNEDKEDDKLLPFKRISLS